jgi:hypothetical protein
VARDFLVYDGQGFKTLTGEIVPGTKMVYQETNFNYNTKYGTWIDKREN